MSFPAVIFGNYEVGIGFTDGSSIPTGGLRVFIVPTINIGPSPLDIGISYIDQFGNIETTTVNTSMSAFTTSGTHIQIVLNAGDTGIRDVTGVTLIGGSPGDKFNLESWNEGLGRPAFSLNKALSPVWTYAEPVKDVGFNRVLSMEKLRAEFYPLPNPRIPTQVPLNRVCPRVTPGYPDPILADPLCTGGDYLSLYLSGFQINGKIHSYVRACPRATPGYPNPILTDPLCIGGNHISEPPSGREQVAKPFLMFKSWLESVVGKVVSGYITNTSGEMVYNAIKLVLISPTTSTGQPGGISDALPVDPSTGLYQAFVKNVVYTDRYVIIQTGIGKYTSLKGGGTPYVIDGSQTLPTPYNLQFDCPTIECDFDMTRKT